jgi:hypothetical protein
MKSQFQHVHIEWASIESDSVCFSLIVVRWDIKNRILFYIHLATQTAHLTILSTPRRYISLYLYAAYGIFFVVILILTALCPRRSLLRWFTLNR